MRRLLVVPLLVSVLLTACDKPEPPKPFESVEALVANPERLRELRAACKADHAKVGDAQCNAVAEATRRRFMAGGSVPTPSTPSTPAAPSSPATPEK